jgi:hypothetical protein
MLYIILFVICVKLFIIYYILFLYIYIYSLKLLYVSSIWILVNVYAMCNIFIYVSMYVHAHIACNAAVLCICKYYTIIQYTGQTESSCGTVFSISIIVHSGTGWWSLMTVRYFGGSNYRPVSNNRYQMSLIKLCIDLRIPGTIKAKMLVTRYSSNLLRMWIHSFRLETLTTQIFCSILVLSTYIHIYNINIHPSRSPPFKCLCSQKHTSGVPQFFPGFSW